MLSLSALFAGTALITFVVFDAGVQARQVEEGAAGSGARAFFAATILD
jgi:hypothetical protein